MSKERGATVLLTDAGGRGAVLAEAYLRSPHVGRVIAVPGNAWVARMGEEFGKTVEVHPHLKTTDPEVIEICKREQVDLADFCQDHAVAVGQADKTRILGIPTVGPGKDAAQIEWDKAWARQFGEKYGLPQPFFRIFDSPQKGIQFVESQPDQPWFVKAAFLAEGKGSLPAGDREEAIRRIEELQEEKFQGAGRVYLVEKWLRGDDDYFEEFSTFILCDGEGYTLVGNAQDYKRAYDNDEGENTGSMGSSGPPLVLTLELLGDIEKKSSIS